MVVCLKRMFEVLSGCLELVIQAGDWIDCCLHHLRICGSVFVVSQSFFLLMTINHINEIDPVTNEFSGFETSDSSETTNFKLYTTAEIQQISK